MYDVNKVDIVKLPKAMYRVDYVDPIKLTMPSMVVFYLPYHHDDDNHNDRREIVYGITRGRETVYSSKETRM